MQIANKAAAPIGIFDSGYGGLTVMKEIVKRLPEYDYLYLGDNARSPYGTRSFETVYQYTLEAVEWFFKQGCPLVILACNTSSAKALRSIQQQDLPRLGAEKRVLGVIRPTAETIGAQSKSGHVGLLATRGTVSSDSYPLEMMKFFPHLVVTQEACPIWVPLIENNQHATPGASWFIQNHVKNLMDGDPDIDTVLLACTHYPLIEDQIVAAVPKNVRVLSQGAIVAGSLADYLQRHPEMEERISRERLQIFFTTDSVPDFERQAGEFFGSPVNAMKVSL